MVSGTWTQGECPLPGRSIGTRSLSAAVGVVVAWLALGCATPVGVNRITPMQANRSLTANVLTTGRLDPTAAEFLYRLDLSTEYREDPPV